MADVKRTAGATTGQSSTIAAAITWLQSNWTAGTDDIGIIELVDAQEFNESNLSLSGFSGTTSATSYPVITTASGVRHSGVAGTGHARIRGNTATEHVVVIGTNYGAVTWCEIQQDSNGSSDEGIRINSGVTNFWVSGCIIWNDQSAGSQDGIYAGAITCSGSVDNCVIYGWTRAGINAQNYVGSGTQTWNIDHCTMVKNGASGQSETGLHNRAITGASSTMNVYNTFSDDAGFEQCFDTAGSGGTETWTGTHNGCTDTSLTSRSLTTGAQESLTVNTTNFTNVTAGSEDYSLPGTGSALYNVGTNRQASEPDSRQDFSVDIAGNARATGIVNIGAFEIASGSSVAPLAVNHLSSLHNA